MPLIYTFSWLLKARGILLGPKYFGSIPTGSQALWQYSYWIPSTLVVFLLDPKYFIIIIQKGWQWKAEREQLTPYQSKDPNHTTPTHRMKEEKGKTAGDKK